MTPAEQMRYGTELQLRDAGYSGESIRELREVRRAFEAAVRGTISRERAQHTLDRFASRPWFPLAWVPRRLADPPRWPDMDYEPVSTFERVRVPTLLFYGERDEWSPIDASIAAWRRAGRRSGNRAITIRRLPGTTHCPTLGGRRSSRAISPVYHQVLDEWLASWVRTASPGTAR